MLTLPETKAHLRVDHDDEDALITTLMETAAQQVAEYLDRNVYADQATLDAAIVDAPAALTAAIVAYDAAAEAALLLVNDLERGAAQRYALDAYSNARATSDRTRRGIVANASIKAAALLLVGDLYEHREAQTDRLLTRNATYERLLNPYRDLGA